MSKKKERILIVEDQETWVAALTAKLSKKFEVVVTDNGEEAVEKAKEIKPRIMILDYHLEGQMTGLDTLKQLRKVTPDTKVIMFSAQDDVQTAVDILDNGAYEYIVKGENAMNRLTIVLRNLEESDVLRRQVVEMRLRFKREKLYLWIVILGILLGSLIVYLNTCPQYRMIDWDPFGLGETAKCSEAVGHSPNN